MRATIVLAHGLAEHSGRYAYVAEQLNAAGFAVYSVDYRGHGQSPGEQRGGIEAVNELVDDLTLAVETAIREQSEKPLYMLAHSLGTLVGLLYVLDHQAQFAGLISSGTPLGLAAYPAPLRMAVRGLSVVRPQLPVLKLQTRDICRDVPTAAYDTDPLNYRGPLTAQTLAQLILAGERILPRLSMLTLPLLILHGGEDKIAPGSGSQLLSERAASSDKVLKIYPDCYHEILNEYERDEVIADITGWLTHHLAVTLS